MLREGGLGAVLVGRGLGRRGSGGAAQGGSGAASGSETLFHTDRPPGSFGAKIALAARDGAMPAPPQPVQAEPGLLGFSLLITILVAFLETGARTVRPLKPSLTMTFEQRITGALGVADGRAVAIGVRWQGTPARELQLLPSAPAGRPWRRTTRPWLTSGCGAVGSRASRSCWRRPASCGSSAMPSPAFRAEQPSRQGLRSRRSRLLCDIPHHRSGLRTQDVTCNSFALDFAQPGLVAALRAACIKKDPLQRKESDEMEPSGLEPLTPCMPCRCSTS